MIKKFKALILIMLFAVSAAFGADFKQLDEAQSAEAIRKIDASCAGIKSLSADFKQVKEMAILQEKMVSKGKMCFADGMLRWEYVSPYTYLFILNKEKVLLQSSQTTNKMDVNSNRLFKSIARIIMNSITGQGLSGEGDFKVRMFLSDGRYMAELEPLRKEIKQMFKTVRLHFGKDLKVSEVVLVDNSGETVITIQNAEYNKPVDAKLFVVD
ncbi:MAG TPA: cell envelope biogenesis protein LolA [Rikenellaceae bacterium]|nr:cell envelope biogenesis protein LolA [Rikenellaceae bacterium]HCQ72036.1 cell envelope biogenesis protein LolA [Rikenellaceae bacterium]